MACPCHNGQETFRIFAVSKLVYSIAFWHTLMVLFHYCPVKVDKAFFEIIEIQSTTVLFKGATI